MQILVNLPESALEMLKTYHIILSQRSGKTLINNILNAVAAGTPLPEHHGRLIDANILESKLNEVFKVMEEVPTIIPATEDGKQTLLDKMEEEFGKDWDVPKQTATKGDE